MANPRNPNLEILLMARYLKNTDPRFHLVEVQARWTLRILIVLILCLIALTGWHQEWLRASRKVVFTAPSSEGIAPGIGIRLSGFRVGKVKSVTLAGPGEVRVEGIIFEKYAEYLGTDSVAILRSENLISDRFIEMTPGTNPAANPLGPGTPIALQAEPGIGAMVDAFREELRPVIDEMAGITRYLTDPEGDLKTSIANIRAITETLDQETGPTLTGARSAITSIERMVAEFQNPEGSLQRSLASIETLTETLDTRVTPMLDEFETAATSATEMFEHADSVFGEIETIVRETGPEVPPMVRQSRDTIDKADEVVGSVRNMWPLRNTIPADGEKTLRPAHDRP